MFSVYDLEEVKLFTEPGFTHSEYVEIWVKETNPDIIYYPYIEEHYEEHDG